VGVAVPLDDCFEFLGKSFSSMTDLESYANDAELLLGDSAGYWCVGQLIGHHPDSDDERRLVAELSGVFRTLWPAED
jgi:hypothetical protein